LNKRVRELEIAGVIEFTRQRDWFDPTTEQTKLTVIGAGGIGSLFTLMAGKLGISKITIYDDDLIESHNLPNQLFPLDSFGYYKADAMSSTLEAFTISEPVAKNEKVTKDTRLSGLIVSGVDSMDARKEIAQAVHANRLNIPRYWDARIGGEKIVIYSVNPRDPAEWAAYEKTLYSDEDAQEDPCTRRSVIDVMGHVGSHLLTGVREQLAGETPAGFIYMHVGEKTLFSGTLEAAVGEVVS
jgi:molybdopterin/thiamine biosynthesis adenylyltransferase